MSLLMPSSAAKEQLLAAAGPLAKKIINANNFQEKLGSVGRQDA
jgi:hypothetical protein